MRRYKVQWAYANEIGTPAIHTNEPAARGEVAYLLGTWIRRNLTDYLKRLQEQPDKRPEFREGIEYLLPELQRLMGEDLVWDAYALWEDFYIRFQNEFEYPLFVGIGTVIVEGSKETGLQNRIPLLETSDVAPIEQIKGPVQIINRLENKKLEMAHELLEIIARKADLKGMKISMEDFVSAIVATERELHKTGQYHLVDEEAESQFLAMLREGTLRRLFPKLSGLGLGAFQSWLVQYADFGGAWHPGRHSNEERAKEQAREYLTVLIHHLGTHSDSESRTGRNQEYVMEAEALIQHIHYMLDMDYVWTAYLDYKSFEGKWNRHFAPFPLEMAIGTMRVIPEPEPEQSL